jgi:hypothetical protein
MNAKQCKALRLLFQSQPSADRTYVRSRPNNRMLVNLPDSPRSQYKRAKKMVKSGVPLSGIFAAMMPSR